MDHMGTQRVILSNRFPRRRATSRRFQKTMAEAQRAGHIRPFASAALFALEVPTEMGLRRSAVCWHLLHAGVQ